MPPRHLIVLSTGLFFRKLLDHNIPILAVRLLCVWYSSQQFSVQWGCKMSDSFYVSNGVWQGGILSPFLFNVYIDDLSIGLNRLKVGCNFNGVSVKHIAYAGDTVLLSPAPSVLQKLIKFCSQYAVANDIFYNLRRLNVCVSDLLSLRTCFFPHYT